MATFSCPSSQESSVTRIVVAADQVCPPCISIAFDEYFRKQSPLFSFRHLAMARLSWAIRMFIEPHRDSHVRPLSRSHAFTTLGKVKIAEMLCRAGLHLGVTTVGRILKERPTQEPTTPPAKPSEAGRVVTAKYPNHVWHVDLTTVPLTNGGLWTSWFRWNLDPRAANSF